MPPKIVRRLVIAPLVAAVDLLLVLLSPVLLLLGVIASPFFGGWRPLRMITIVLVFATRHLAAMLACLGLWIASGFGLRRGLGLVLRAHYRVMALVRGRRLRRDRAARARARARDGVGRRRRALSSHGRPVLVLSRHAGEGDTLLVMHELLRYHDRGPRVVMHDLLRLDPLIDVLGERLPNRFVDPRGGDTEVEIAAMASEMGGSAALVIFPEGGNFTPQRRERGIERLEEAGHEEEAEWARAMRHVIAPRPGGALAAIKASPDADVVIMGHDGFPNGLGEVWRLLPEPQTIELRLWHEPASAIPDDPDAQIDWLFGWWRTLDEWVEERRAAKQTAALH